MNAILSVCNINKQIQQNNVLSAINFSLQQNEKLAIIGGTGMGKTTLLKIIAGLTQPTSGKVFIQNEQVLGPQEKLIAGHAKIAYVSQHYELLNNYKIIDFLNLHYTGLPSYAQKVFELCGIVHLLYNKTNEASGGEKQRIALAQQLLKQPKVLLLDEPFSNLDFITKQQIKQVLNNVVEEWKMCSILVSHEPSDVLQWATNIAVLEEGKIIQYNQAQTVYNQPVNAYAAALLGHFSCIQNIDERNKLGIKNSNVIYYRPHQFIINKMPTGVEACVAETSFLGNYYLIKANSVYSCYYVTSNTLYATGQKVLISLV